MNSNQLIDYLNTYLRISDIPDYGPQGLQVEAENSDIQRIALAVDTAPATIAAAAEWQADLLLVHHGLLWRSVERIAGPLGTRVRLLLANNIHLYAAHLALDAHSQVGNNVMLAEMMGATVTGKWCDVMGTPIGVLAETAKSLAQITAEIETQLHIDARVLNHGPAQVNKLAIISGFGADRVAEAHALGADTLLTGETSHANYYAAADYGMNVIFAGHYATETAGVKALGQHLQEQFDLETRFFDFPTAM
jgi:dinuclear metal center YbgI/SA1388 family protein